MKKAAINNALLYQVPLRYLFHSIFFLYSSFKLRPIRFYLGKNLPPRVTCTVLLLPCGRSILADIPFLSTGKYYFNLFLICFIAQKLFSLSHKTQLVIITGMLMISLRRYVLNMQDHPFLKNVSLPWNHCLKFVGTKILMPDLNLLKLFLNLIMSWLQLLSKMSTHRHSGRRTSHIKDYRFFLINFFL